MDYPNETYDFDPARRRTTRKRGKVPPQLRSWVYGKRRKATRKYDPTRRRKTRRKATRYYDYAPRRKFKRRRYDLPLGNRFLGCILQPMVTTLGGIFHNWLSVKRGILSGSWNIAGVGVLSHLGLLGGMLGAIIDYTTPNKLLGAIANAFGSGMLDNGLNVPAIEQVVTPQAIAQATGQNGAALTTPYVPAW